MDQARIESGTFSSAGIEVEYLFQPARGDREHLIVLFSGFGRPGNVDYYREAQRSFRTNVLWIVDRFDGHFSYYLRAFGGVDITSAIHSLIEERRVALGLSIPQVSLAGFSKGASAALYYALAFNYPRVVAAAPRYRIGTYIKQHRPKELESMAGNTESMVSELDHLFYELVARKCNPNCSVVLMTSPADDRHLTEAAPLAGVLNAYDNFVVVNTLSPQVMKHQDVTSYNVPLINSLLILASEGVEWPLSSLGADSGQDAAFNAAAGTSVPMVHNGLRGLSPSHDPESILSEQAESGALEGAASSISLDESGTLHVEGYMFRRGTAAPSYGIFTPTLVLQNQHTRENKNVPLGALRNDALTASHYQRTRVDYSHAGFASPRQNGFNLSHLSPGHYRVGARWRKDGVALTTEEISAPEHEIWRLVGDRWIGSVCQGKTWTLHSIDAAGRPGSDSYTELTSMSTKSALIFPRGYFIPRGMDHPRWDSVKYALSAVPLGDSTAPVRSFALANDNRKDASRRTGEPWRDQSKATFSTRHHAGLDVSSLSSGRYELRVSARRKDDVQSLILPGTLVIDDGLSARPLVGIIGSCASLDNFRSWVRPGWKEDFVLHGTAYQSSLISFFAPALDVRDDVVSDLGAHDAAVTLDDMRKGYRERIARDAPEFLIVDVLADARMGVIGVDDTWITDNVWTVRNSGFYRSLDTSTRRSFETGHDQYLELYREACARFALFLRASAPNTRIVLNRARGVTRHRGLDHPGGLFDEAEQSLLNEKRALLEIVFLEEVYAEVIDPMFEGAVSDSEHPMGAGPDHYEQAVYERFRMQLRAIAGADVTATWLPAAGEAPRT